MLLADRYCRCGAPFYTRLFREWNKDGTSTARYHRDIRLCHVEADEINRILAGISREIGYPVDRLAMEGERKAFRAVTEGVLHRGTSLLAAFAKTSIGGKQGMKVALEVGRTVGHGDGRRVEYEPGRRAILEVEGAVSAPLVAGDAMGLFETVHNVTAGIRLEERGDILVIELEKVKDGLTWEDVDRLALENQPTRPGRYDFTRCTRCNTPLEVTKRIKWDVAGGMVTDRRTGARLATILATSLNAVIRELSKELGDEIPRMVAEIEREYVAESVAGRLKRLKRTELQYKELMADFRPFGMGNPVEVARGRGRLTAWIDNPFCQPMIAGRIAGLFQVVEEEVPRFEWTAGNEPYMIVEVST